MLRTGLDRLLDERLARLRGRRVGLVTHPAAVLPDLTHAADALAAAGARLAALFGPEHGLLGAAAEGASVGHTLGPGGVRTYSLYGETLEPTDEMLEGVELLVFDMQDVGARFYTYLSTLFYVLRAAGRAGVPLLVLDRPNPLGGEALEGPTVAPGFESFVGIAPLPVRHGLTLGEAAGWMNAALGLGAELEVASLSGWRRSMRFTETGRAWVPTSPGMAHLGAVALYPGTCLVEGTTMSVGRGTALPFEVCGAPWLDGEALARRLNARGLAGVRFRAAHFTPAGSAHAGQLCGGVQLHVTDERALRPLTVGLELVAAARAQHPEAFGWQAAHFDRLIGSGDSRAALEAGADPAEVARSWRPAEERFRAEREPFLLY